MNTISLEQMTSLARALLDAEEATEQADRALKDAKERERLLREETIPSAMQELGLEELKLNTGQKVSVKQDVYASIPKANKDSAFAWLTDNGFDGLIKVSVEVLFDRGELEQAAELYNKLGEDGQEVVFSQDVHSQTLKAFLREQISKGSNIPLDLFGARPVWTAKISNK